VIERAIEPDAPLWRVLIIDDSPDDCAEVRRLLLKGSEQRYSFSTAATGDAGVQAIRDADRGPPDCVILDHNLPDRDAVGILEAIRGPYGLPVCPVVVLTGRAESEIGRRVLRAGAQDLLGKENITPGSLTRALENASERYTMARELRASEAALRASDQRLRVATRVAGLAVAEIDYETHLIHLSREAAVLFGMPAVEVAVSRASIHALFHPDDRPQLERMIAASHDPSGHGEFSLEFRVILADGTVRWHNVRKQVFFANGRPERALMALFDITDRKEFEEQLKRNHESFVKLVENNPFGLYVVDSDFRMLQLSLGARKVFSSVSPLIGRDFSEVLRIVWPAQFAEAVTARFRHTLETGEPYFAPSTVERRADVGETEAYEWRIERVALPDGSNGVVCYFYDLTERQQWEAALLAKEQELRSLADNSPDILTRLDRNFRHVFVNATIKQATGRVAAEFLGKTHRELGIPAPLCAQWEADLRKVFASGYQRSFEFISDTPNGSRHYATQLVPEFDSDGAVEFVLAVSHDVTDSKRAEVAIRESEERLARAQRAAKVGTWEWDLDTGHSSWTLEA
jgi:PAS domain S-box-containing protein